MAILPIVLHPHPSLYTNSEPVTAFDASLHAFLDDMAETMYDANGIGLAANQVDVLKRVIVIDPSPDKEAPQLMELINPEVIEKSGTITWEEGCLSFPKVYAKIKRANAVTVTYQDRYGAHHEISGEELLAVVLQHEIDHINGICFTSHMGMAKKRLLLKELKKVKIELARQKEEQSHSSDDEAVAQDAS